MGWREKGRDPAIPRVLYLAFAVSRFKSSLRAFKPHTNLPRLDCCQTLHSASGLQKLFPDRTFI